MKLDEVSTLPDFHRFVGSLLPIASASEMTLEAYLCAVLGLVVAHRDALPSYRLFAEILAQAFDAETIGVNCGPLVGSSARPEASDEYRKLLDRLVEQVVDLRQMREAGQLDLPAGEQWLGLRAPSGRQWFNVTVYAYLEPTARRADHEPDEDDEEDAVSWLDFRFVIDDGQYWE